MDRIDTPGSVSGAFTEASPLEGLIPTQIGPQWLNDIQEDVVGWILISGQNLSKGTQTQILLGLLIISQAQLAAHTGRELEVVAPLTVAAGDLVAVEDLFGTAGAAVSVGFPMTSTRMGVHTLTKNAGETWLAGETVYWDLALKSATNVSGTGGLKRIGFSPGPAESAATSAAVLLDGNSAPETVPLPIGSGLVKTITAPSGYRHTDTVRVVNGGAHFFVIWDASGAGGDNLAALYTATDAVTTPVWTQVVVDQGSKGDHAREARDSGEWVVTRDNNEAFEISKWDATGRLWVSTRYGFGVFAMQRAGISADGSRVVLISSDNDDPGGIEIIVMDGADETPTVKWPIGASFVWNAELSSDGSRLIAYVNSSAAVINVDTGAILAALPCDGLIQDDVGDRQSFVGISADGASIVSGHQTNGEVRLGVWNGSNYSVTTLVTPATLMAVSMSDDGKYSAIWTETNHASGGDPRVTIYDMATGAVAVDGKGGFLDFALEPTAYGRPGRIHFSADGTTFVISLDRNDLGPMVWVGETGSSTLTEVYSAPALHMSKRGHFANALAVTDVQETGGSNGFVTLHNLT